MTETENETGSTAVTADTSRVSPAVLASVVLALYYYAQEDKQRGQFVGLWPTTILALAIYFKLDEIKSLLQAD